MSNLYKPNFVGLGKLAGDPFVLDLNSRIDEKINSGSKIIRPVEEIMEKEEDGEDENCADEFLSETSDMANAMLEEAKMQAEIIIMEANEEASKIREAAKSEGYEQGLKEGQEQAASQNQQYLADLQQEQEQIIALGEKKLEEYCNDAEEKLVEFSCDIIKKLTGILVDDYKPVVLHMINEALNGEETGKNIVIKIPEESYAYVYDNKDRISLAANPSINIEIFADAKLNNRQCIIETDNGIIDLSMDLQVNNLITAIKLLS